MAARHFDELLVLNKRHICTFLIALPVTFLKQKLNYRPAKLVTSFLITLIYDQQLVIFNYHLSQED